MNACTQKWKDNDLIATVYVSALMSAFILMKMSNKLEMFSYSLADTLWHIHNDLPMAYTYWCNVLQTPHNHNN